MGPRTPSREGSFERWLLPRPELQLQLPPRLLSWQLAGGQLRQRRYTKMSLLGEGEEEGDGERLPERQQPEDAVGQ